MIYVLAIGDDNKVHATIGIKDEDRERALDIVGGQTFIGIPIMAGLLEQLVALLNTAGIATYPMAGLDVVCP